MEQEQSNIEHKWSKIERNCAHLLRGVDPLQNPNISNTKANILSTKSKHVQYKIQIFQYKSTLGYRPACQVERRQPFHVAMPTQRRAQSCGRVIREQVCITNDPFYIKNDEICIENDDLFVSHLGLRQHYTSNCKTFGPFSMQNRHFSGAILHHLCIFN